VLISRASWLACSVTGGKSGGFGEVKTKSTKKKYLSRDKDEADSDQDDSAGQSESTDTVFMSSAEIGDELQHQSTLVDCSPEFSAAVASHLYRYITELCNSVIYRVVTTATVVATTTVLILMLLILDVFFWS